MSTESTSKDDEIVVQEAQDGSAIVDLPESIAPASDDSSPEDQDAADDAAKRAEIAATGSVDPDQEALREAKRLKRQKRKEYHRQVSTEKDIKLQNLERQNQQLLERLSVIERKTYSADLARVDKAIEDQQTRIMFAKQKIKEAAETSNGELLVSAQDMLVEASKNHDALQNIKRQATQPAKEQGIKPPDPLLQRYAKEWMSRNSWYDPNAGDEESDIALRIDDRLSKEGFDPRTPDYWEELDSRLQKYLPHRYTDNQDERPSAPRPRNVVTGSGRESAPTNGSKGSLTLTREQVNAMKEAGFWDDPEKRARMIRRYATEARLKNGNRS